MIEVKTDSEQIATLAVPTEPLSRKWDVKTIAKNTLIPAVAMGAATLWSIAIAHWTIDQGPPRPSTREIIDQMRADPNVYPQFNRKFSLQKFMPENPEVGKCKYFDPWEFWGIVINDPESPEKLKLVLCAPQEPDFTWDDLKRSFNLP